MTTTIQVDTVAKSLLIQLNATGITFGDNEMPKPIPSDTLPYGILYTVAGGTTGQGAMANPNDMGTIAFQVRIVGHTREQARAAQQKYMLGLETLWGSISGCLGPGRFTIGGIVKEDERTFVSNDTIYMEVTGV
jgi:hypothetical protein